MSSEQQLMAGIIPHQYQKGIFEKISRESLDLVIRDSDAIISRVKKSSSNNDFLSIISVFQGKNNLQKNLEFYKNILIFFFPLVVKHVHMLKPSMDRTLEASDLGIRGKYNKMTELFYITGSHGLDTFVDGKQTKVINENFKMCFHEFFILFLKVSELIPPPKKKCQKMEQFFNLRPM